MGTLPIFKRIPASLRVSPMSHIEIVENSPPRYGYGGAVSDAARSGDRAPRLGRRLRPLPGGVSLQPLRPGRSPGPRPHPHLVAPDLAQFAAATEQSFKGQFRGTPIVRTGKGGMLRNLALAAAGR
jgi:hypothetical protein